MNKLLAILLTLHIGTELIACGCDSPTSLKQVQNHAYVFIGDIIEKKVVEREHILVLDVVKNIKDVYTAMVELKIRTWWPSSCDLNPDDFKSGERYIFSARRGSIGYNFDNVEVLYAHSGMCNLRKKMDKELSAHGIKMKQIPKSNYQTEKSEELQITPQ